MQAKAPMNRWAIFFSRKDVSLICFFLAILFKLIYAWYFLHLSHDKLFQAMAAKNLAEGHGLTIQQVHTPDLSTTVYEPMEGWPPGYSVIVAGLYLMVRDVGTACFLLDMLVIVFYFVLLRKLLRLLQFPGWLVNLLLLFSGLRLSPDTMLSTPTDLLTLAVTMYACYLTLLLVNKERKFGGWWLGIVNAIPAWLRYMSIPAALVIPALLLWNGWVKKDKRLLRYGWQSGVLAVLGIVSVLVFQKLYVGAATYVQPTETGLFFKNLLRMYPMFFGALVNLDFVCVQLELRTGVGYASWMAVLTWINYVLFAIGLGWFLYYGFTRKWRAVSVWQTFLFVGGLIVASTVALLAFLSLTISDYYPLPKDYSWTYLSDPRYFVFFDVVFLVLVSRWLFVVGLAGKTKRWLQIGFFALLAFEMGHGLYYQGKYVTLDRRYNKNFVLRSQMERYVDSTIRHTRDDVIVCGESTIAHNAVLMGGKGLFNRAEMLAPKFYVRRPTVMLMYIRDRELPYYDSMLKERRLRPVTKFNDCNVYRYYLEPR